MTHRRGAIWTERVLLGLIVVSLAGTLNLLIAIHRRASTDRHMAISEASSIAKKAEPEPAISAPSPIVAPVETPAPAQKAELEPPPLPVEDPTKKAIASLTAAKAKEIEAAQAADQRTGAMDAAYQSAIAESGAGRDAKCSCDSRSPASRPMPRNWRRRGRSGCRARRSRTRARCHQGRLAKASSLGFRRAALQGTQRHMATADRDRMHPRRRESPTARAEIHRA